MTTKERNYGLKKKCEKLEYENKVLKRALELASEPRDDWGVKECAYPSTNYYYDYFINQAKKEVEDE